MTTHVQKKVLKSGALRFEARLRDAQTGKEVKYRSEELDSAAQGAREKMGLP